MDMLCWIPASLSVVLALIITCQGSCPSDEWFERDGLCYLFQVTPVTHPTAELSCADMGASIASITDSNRAYFVKSIYPSSQQISTLWSKYLLFRDGSDVIVTDKVDNITNCAGCDSLKPSMISMGLNLSCIVIGGITETSSNWNLADCFDSHQVVCEKCAEPGRGLESKDIAAIICLSFLIVSFVIVITIDLIKNPVPDDTRQLIVRA